MHDALQHHAVVVAHEAAAAEEQQSRAAEQRHMTAKQHSGSFFWKQSTKQERVRQARPGDTHPQLLCATKGLGLRAEGETVRQAVASAAVVWGCAIRAHLGESLSRSVGQCSTSSASSPAAQRRPSFVQRGAAPRHLLRVRPAQQRRGPPMEPREKPERCSMSVAVSCTYWVLELPGGAAQKVGPRAQSWVLSNSCLQAVRYAPAPAGPAGLHCSLVNALQLRHIPAAHTMV